MPAAGAASKGGIVNKDVCEPLDPGSSWAFFRAHRVMGHQEDVCSRGECLWQLGDVSDFLMLGRFRGPSLAVRLASALFASEDANRYGCVCIVSVESALALLSEAASLRGSRHY